MGLKTGIEWTATVLPDGTVLPGATWNPWTGCTKISPACAHCYMFTDMKRYGKDGSVVRRSKPPTFNLPLKKKRDGAFAIPPGSKVFTCSWSDWFHVKADPWRAEAWAIIRQRPDVTFQIVTKRTERIAECLPSDWGLGYPNVWLIATVENQEWADVRIPQLLSVPAVVHGLSCEPLLGPIVLPNEFLALGRRAWTITGGESGHQPRPTHPAWVQSIRDQCVAADVPHFLKQWGEWVDLHQSPECSTARDNGHNPGFCPIGLDGLPIEGGRCADRSRGEVTVYKFGKKLTGRLLDGRTWDEFPQVA
jgi:protein gp37